MAFDARHFVICSKFPLFKADCNLWLYTTSDSLEDCLAENYFQPRMNTKNQDSPEVGDIIQCILGSGTLAYLTITAKTEKPYNITVEKTYLENEAEIYDAIYTAADKGEQLYQTGVWYAKMYSDTVVPTGSEYEDRNYADFSQVDSDNNPIIVIYECQSGVWTEIQRITPPTEYNGYLPITSKFWDIQEQTGQQGGEVLWSYNTKRFTPFPRIISYDSIHITGDSTVVIPDNPSSTQIVNKDYVDEAIAAIPTPTVDIKQSIDAEIVGALTINDGDVSGFDTNKYLTFPGSLDMTGASSFEIVFAFTKKNNNLGYLLAEKPVGVLSDKHLTFIASTYLRFDVNDGSNYQTLEGTTSLAADTKYYGKIAYDGTNYTLSLSTDGITYTTEDTAAAQYIPGYTSYEYLIGRASTTFDNIHLAESYIKKNGILIWQGMDAPGLHQRVPIGHEVIEFQAPTAANNYKWYRKYADGWVEQGGETVDTTGTVSVALPVEMQDTHYTITCSAKGGNKFASVSAYTTTDIQLAYYAASGTSAVPLCWYVCGMAA